MIYSCIDAFSGAGGLCLGLQNAGFKILKAFDNDPKCVETQRLNQNYLHHEVILADIEEMLNGVLLAKGGLIKGELFLLSGGPPCQGFSVQRIGQDNDVRNELVIKFVRLVQEIRPTYFMMENVPGIEGKRGQTILSEALSIASESGYLISKKTLDAQDYGVPQRRRRLFVVGERSDGSLRKFHFPVPSTPNGQRRTVYQTIGHLPSPPEDGTDHPQVRHHRRDKLSEINKRRLQALEPGQGRTHLPKELLADCHLIDPSIIGHRNVYGRMRWDDVAPTITARFDSFTRGQFGHPEQVRSISLREGAMLQTFPIDFEFSGTKVEIARQIGNAVPPLLAEALGRQIINCHERSQKENKNEF